MEEMVETSHLFWTNSISFLTFYGTLDIQTLNNNIYHTQLIFLHVLDTMFSDVWH
jgi:hypothetical protein